MLLLVGTPLALSGLCCGLLGGLASGPAEKTACGRCHQSSPVGQDGEQPEKLKCECGPHVAERAPHAPLSDAAHALGPAVRPATGFESFALVDARRVRIAERVRSRHLSTLLALSCALRV